MCMDEKSFSIMKWALYFRCEFSVLHCILLLCLLVYSNKASAFKCPAVNVFTVVIKFMTAR